MNTASQRAVFPAIVVAQFCGTSLWFAGNAIVLTLQPLHNWPESSSGHLTTAVQAGFILGTLLIALTGLSDRVSPSRLFFFSCVLGASMNSVLLFDETSFALALTSRILTGIALGGIYPIGMKIASDWRKEGLGDWLGALVGALVFGTALPHALRSLPIMNETTYLLSAISVVAIVGGLLILIFVPDGPYRKKSQRFTFRNIRTTFRSPAFRRPVYGYFGHMWELYTFWALVPWIIATFKGGESIDMASPTLSFFIIACGGIGCWIGGKLSQHFASMRVARIALLISGVCCLASPLMWHLGTPLFLLFLFVWGFAVVSDSPQFSASVASNAPAENRGTALTLTTCIGFAITIVSIQCLHLIQPYVDYKFLLLFLAPGPIIGLLLSSDR